MSEVINDFTSSSEELYGFPVPDFDGQPRTDKPTTEYNNRLLATIAHELRNPLQVAASFNKFLLENKVGDLSYPQKDIVASIASSLEQAQVLIDDLLCLDQINRGQLSLEFKLVEVNSLVREVASQYKLIAEAAEANLEVVWIYGEACYVLAAHNRLKQCLQNLLSNSMKFTPIGGLVRVLVESSGNNYHIVVEDNGPGITPENLSLIFQSHYHSSNSHLAGYGLGLSITKELIERMGGKIGVESKIGQGSRFWISLPKIS